jgi:hypothetical protein
MTIENNFLWYGKIILFYFEEEIEKNDGTDEIKHESIRVIGQLRIFFVSFY